MFKATDSQWDYLEALVKERQLNEAELIYLDQAITGQRAVTASNLIDWLQARPKDPERQVGIGIYKREDAFYLVRVAKTTGNRYAAKLVISGDAPTDYEWRYIPGVISVLSAGDKVYPQRADEIMRKYPPSIVRLQPKKV